LLGNAKESSTNNPGQFDQIQTGTFSGN